MKDNFLMNVIGTIVVSFFIVFLLLILFAWRREPSSKEEEDLASRIISIESGTIDEYYNYKIIADRETDVEYLIIQKAGDGIGVSIMRDSGGMVKLRE